jgi:hypothetical protein
MCQPFGSVRDQEPHMELDSIYNEVIVGMSKREWYQLIKYVWDKRFQFMFIDTTKPFNKMYHKNFNPLEITTEQDEFDSKLPDVTSSS